VITILIDADLSALEWRVGAELSRDVIMVNEIVSGVDMHTLNAIALFGDAKYRQEAKVCSFRFLYGGSAYGFHLDYRMPQLGIKKWQSLEEDFKDKYKGLIKWQNNNFNLVCKQGYLKSFTGREYVFNKNKNKDGSWGYIKAQVCNFPCQGCATADIMPLCMLVIYRKLKKLGYLEKGVKLVNQVHDSIILDSPNKYVEEVGNICYTVFNSIPQLVKNYWGYTWVTPMTGEIKIGNNWSDMNKLSFT